MAFVGRFGPLLAERPLWGYVSNVRDDGIVREGALLFHSDFAFTPHPVATISLHALQVPPSGTSTLFADAAAASTLVPPELRARLADRRVVNVYDFFRPDDKPMRIDEVDPRSPRTEHPVIGVHPRTGAAVVLANELHTDHIVGLPHVESDALLADLFDVMYSDANVVEHQWQSGDLVVWDNVALQHGRTRLPRRGAEDPAARHPRRPHTVRARSRSLGDPGFRAGIGTGLSALLAAATEFGQRPQATPDHIRIATPRRTTCRTSKARSPWSPVRRTRSASATPPLVASPRRAAAWCWPISTGTVPRPGPRSCAPVGPMPSPWRPTWPTTSRWSSWPPPPTTASGRRTSCC